MTSCVKREFMNERLSEKKRTISPSDPCALSVMFFYSNLASDPVTFTDFSGCIKYPGEPKKNLFHPLQSLSVYHCAHCSSHDPLISACYISHFLYTYPSGNIPKLSNLPWSMCTQESSWSALYLFTGTYCAIHCTKKKKTEICTHSLIGLHFCFLCQKKILVHLKLGEIF